MLKVSRIFLALISQWELMVPVRDLLRIKMEVPELKLIPRVNVINSYIESELPRICEEIKELPEEKLHGYDELNEMFLKYIW